MCIILTSCIMHILFILIDFFHLDKFFAFNFTDIRLPNDTMVLDLVFSCSLLFFIISLLFPGQCVSLLSPIVFIGFLFIVHVFPCRTHAKTTHLCSVFQVSPVASILYYTSFWVFSFDNFKIYMWKEPWCPFCRVLLSWHFVLHGRAS